jgi:uncharacterized protein
MLLKFVGLFFIALGMLGAVLPLLPTTPFILVAAACFAKSSPYLYNKLLSNRIFGPLIRDWREYQSIPKRAKRIAIMSILLAVAWSCYVLSDLYLQILVIGLVSWPIIFILRLPLSETKKASD